MHHVRSQSNKQKQKRDSWGAFRNQISQQKNKLRVLSTTFFFAQVSSNKFPTKQAGSFRCFHQTPSKILKPKTPNWEFSESFFLRIFFLLRVLILMLIKTLSAIQLSYQNVFNNYMPVKRKMKRKRGSSHRSEKERIRFRVTEEFRLSKH